MRVFDALDRSADRDPDHEAIRLGEASLSYRELVDASKRLASVLNETGFGRGDCAAILLDKSIESVVAAYGIMRAGGLYVPIDPAAGAARQRWLLRDCRARHLVSSDRRVRLAGELDLGGTRVEQVIGPTDEPWGPSVPWSEVDRAPLATGPALSDADAAYVIYTSGSTGQPKGIVHTHASCLAFCQTVRGLYGLEPSDRVANQAPLHFDMSVFDLFAAAYAGASVVMLPEAHLKLPASLSQLLADQRVTVWFTVPFSLTEIQRRGALESRSLAALRAIVFGGETTPNQTLAALMRRLPHVRFHHMYGPAETNGCTGEEVLTPPVGEAQVPIGTAFPGMDVLCVDGGAVVGAGGSGEIWIHGPTTMRGYWDQPELTARVFEERRGPDGRPRRYYRSGDQAEVLEGGALRFLGRVDRQVKTRGYRVELDDVEVALRSHPTVADVAAYVVPDGQGSQRIEAWVTPAPAAGIPVDEASVRKHAATRLAAWAIPQRFRIVTALPRLSSGKTDYQRIRREAMAGRDEDV
jgi:amino acid adenylation domain-containing protein